VNLAKRPIGRQQISPINLDYLRLKGDLGVLT
ncbi:uncharacterized protein METZ01_LOCUS153419, partial [marine metagenome]